MQIKINSQIGSKIRTRTSKLIITNLLLAVFLINNSKILAQSIINSPDTINHGGMATLSISSSNISAVSWDLGDGQTSNQISLTHVYYAGSCGFNQMQISAIVTDTTGVQTSLSKTIIVRKTAPTPQLIDLDPITPFSNCDNSPSISNPNFNIQLNNATASQSSIVSYTIDWGDNSPIQSLTSTSFPISHTYNQLGLFSIALTALDTNGCTSTTIYQAANQSNPAVGLSSLGATQGCAPQEFSFILAQYQNNSPGTYYVWNFGDGTAPITWDYDDPFINDTIKHVFNTTSCSQSGYSFTVSVTAHSFCDITTATVGNIRIYSSPVAQFTASTDTSCVNSNISLINNTVSGFGYNCNSQALYSWNFGDGSGSTNTTNSSHSYSSPGIYTIVLTATNGVCGSSQDSQTVVINSIPHSLFTSSPLFSCDSLSSNILNLSTGGDLSYTWSSTITTGFQYINGTNNHSEIPELRFYIPKNYPIKLTVSNNCGTDDTTVIFGVGKKPNVNLPTINNYCGNAAFIPTVSKSLNNSSLVSQVWQFPGGNPSSSGSTNPSLVTYSSPGNYDIICTIANGCGVTSDTTNFTIFNLPTISINSNLDTVCKGDTVIIAANGASQYTWNQLFIANNQGNQTASFVVQGTTNYIATGTDVNGCANKDTVQIYAHNLPILQLSTTGDSICNGDSIVYGAIGALNYSWNFQGNLINGNTITIHPQSSGTLILNGTDNNLCKAKITRNYNVFNLPTISLNSNTFNICPSSQVNLVASGANNFTLNGPNTNLNSTGTFTFTPTLPGIYALNAINATGCTADTTVEINIYTSPNISISAPFQSICENDTVQLSASGASIYSWVDSISNTTIAGNYINFSPNQSQAIWVIGTDIHGCKNMDSLFVNVNPLPNLNITKSSNYICQGNSMMLTGFGAINYSWATNGNNVGNTNQITVNPNTTTTYTLIGTNNLGCQSSLSATVAVQPNPIISSNFTQKSICNSDTALIKLLGATTYNFTPPSNIAANNGFFIAQPNSSTSYQVIGTNSMGCTDTIIIGITVNPLPMIEASSNKSNICLGQTVNLYAAGGLNYLWTPNQNLNTNIGDTIIASPTSSIQYRVLGIDSNGCRNVDSVFINVSTNLNVTASASPQSICQGDTLSLTASGASSYSWIHGSNFISTTGSQVLANPNASTNFIVTGTDTNGCINSASVNVVVNPIPNVNINASSSSICIGDSVILTGSGGTSYSWQNSQGQNIGNTQQIIQFPNANETFSLTAMNSYNCVNKKNYNLLVNSLPVIVLTASSDTVCSGSQVNFNATGAQNYSWSSTQLINNPSTHNPSASPSQSAWYLVNATNTYGCKTSDSIKVSVRQLPNFTTNYTNTSICQGDSANIIASGNLNFNWIPTTGLNTTNGSTINASPSNTTIYTVSGTDLFGCTNQKQVLVNVNSKPTSHFSTDTVLCLNSPTTMVNSSIGGATFSWDFGNNTYSSSSNPTVTYTQTGYYPIKLVTSSNQNCSDTIISFVQVISAPVSNFTNFPSAGCSPVVVNFNNLSLASIPTYNWSFGDGGNFAGFNPGTHVFSTPQGHDTMFITKLTTSNKCGVDEFIDTIIVKSKPIANFGILYSTNCSPLNANFGNISSNNATNYFWNFGDNTNSSNMNPQTHIYTTGLNPSTYNISLVASNQCGTDTINKQLTVNPNVVNAAFTPSATASCAPASIIFTNYSNIQTSAFWDFDDGNVSSTINPTHVYNNAGIYDVRLIVTDNCGIDTIFSTITVSNPPTVVFSLSNDTICQGQSIVATNLTPGLSSTNWNFGDNNTSNLNSTNHIYSGFGTYSITLTGTDASSNCSASSNKIIIVNQKATASIAASSTEGCFPLLVNFTNNSSNSTMYSWNFGDGNSSTIFQPQHNYVNAGNFNLSMIANNFQGCSDTARLTLKSYPHPISSFTLAKGNICQYPVEVFFTDQSSGAQGFKWIFDNSDSSYLQNPATEYQSHGTFHPMLIAYNSFGCTDTSIANIVLYPNPEANFKLDTAEGCESLIVKFTNNSVNSTNYTWEFDDNQIDNLINPTHYYEFAGNYIPVLLAYGINGCIDTLESADTIKVYPKPDVDFDIIPIESEFHNIANFQFINQTSFGDYFNWDFGDGTYDSIFNPRHQYNDHGEYTITLYSESSNGCTNQKSSIIEVKLLKGLFIPNALAPNHPNAEIQLLTPKGKGIKDMQIVIYDNWNNIIWQSSKLVDGEPCESWDGTFDGKEMKQGTYFWKASAVFEDNTVWQGCDDGTGKITRQGTITLLR